MRDFGKISGRIWNSEKFRQVTQAAQLVYFNLHTSQSCSTIGLLTTSPYRITADMRSKTGRMSEGEVAACLGELHDVGLIIWDQQAEMIMITKFLDPTFNTISNGKHGKGALKVLAHVENPEILLHGLLQIIEYEDKLFTDDVERVKSTISRLRREKTKQNQLSLDTPMYTPSIGVSDKDKDKDEDEYPLTPLGGKKVKGLDRPTRREAGTNPRSKGTNPRAGHHPAKAPPDIPTEYRDQWAHVLVDAGRSLEAAEIATYLLPLVPFALRDGAVAIRAPSRFLADQVRSRYGGLLATACAAHFGGSRYELVT